MKHNVLLLREPWTAEPLGNDCQDGLVDFGRGLAAGMVGEGTPSALNACAYRMWTKDEYKASLAAVLQAEKEELVGIVGQSFGALPAVAASDLSPSAWLMLHAPIAPANTSGSAVMADRLQVLKSALDSSYALECTRAPLDCSMRGSDIVQSALERTTSQQVKGRSERIQSGDVGLAVVAAAYDLEANGHWLWATLGRFPNIGEHDWNTIGRLADQLVQRFDSNKISPKLGAYVAGMCSSYIGWSDGRGIRHTDVGYFFNAVEGQCGRGSIADAQWLSGPKSGGLVCILANDEDTVVSPRWASDWRAIFPHASLVHYKYRGHISLSQAFSLAGNASKCGDDFRSGFERTN